MTEEQLIEKANLIASETDRVNFIMNYLLQNVQYDYASLIACGYMKGSITKYFDYNKDRKPIFSKNPLGTGKKIIIDNGVEKVCNDSYCLSCDLNGDSDLLDRAVDAFNSCDGNKETRLSNVERVLYEELSRHLENDDICKMEINRLMAKVNNDMEESRLIVTTPKGNYVLLNDIKKILVTYLGSKRKKYFPPLYEQGIIKRGVCEDYADYIAQLLPKVGIVASRIDGTSELKHAWNAAIIDGQLKSIDLTRAVFIRDGFREIPKEQRSSDWLVADFETVFEMQPTRTITMVGNKDDSSANGDISGLKLSIPMNNQNFNKELMAELVNESCYVANKNVSSIKTKRG